MTERPSVMKSAVRFALDSGLNMTLRGLTLASKFFLMVYLAKVLTPEHLGVYALLTVTISYTLFLLGLDFYTYAQREMFSLPRSAWRGIIRSQFMFYAVVYVFILPLLLLIFIVDLLPWKMIGWFYLLVVFEHFSQELYRLLIACEKITEANVTLFLRGGAWIFVVVLIMMRKPDLQSLSSILFAWSIGVAISVWFSIQTLHEKFRLIHEKSTTDWQWIRRGLKVSGKFLLGTLALRGLFTFDRYFLDLYAGKSSVGVYSFYMSIAGAVMAFADAGIISKLYPKIVVAYRSGNFKEYRNQLKNLTIGIVSLYLIISSCIFVAIKPILHYIGRDIYLEHISILWVLLGAMGVFTLGLVPHYALYSRCADRVLVVASILSLLSFLCSAVYLTPKFGALGMALSVLIGVCFLFFIKVAFSVKTKPRQAVGILN